MTQLGIARAPEDLEILEFALKWKKNPQKVREKWSLRDIQWLQLVEEAHHLAAPEIEKHFREQAVKNKKAKG